MADQDPRVEAVARRLFRNTFAIPAMTVDVAARRWAKLEDEDRAAWYRYAAEMLAAADAADTHVRVPKAAAVPLDRGLAAPFAATTLPAAVSAYLKKLGWTLDREGEHAQVWHGRDEHATAVVVPKAEWWVPDVHRATRLINDIAAAEGMNAWWVLKEVRRLSAMLEEVTSDAGTG